MGTLKRFVYVCVCVSIDSLFYECLFCSFCGWVVLIGSAREEIVFLLAAVINNLTVVAHVCMKQQAASGSSSRYQKKTFELDRIVSAQKKNPFLKHFSKQRKKALTLKIS